MGVRRQRSVFWIVSTHLVTTLFTLLALTLIADFAMLALTGGRPPKEVEIASLFGPIILVAGSTILSVRHVRRVAIITKPRSCYIASTIAFSIILLAPMSALLYVGLRTRNITYRDASVIGAYGIGAAVVFYFLTKVWFQLPQTDIKTAEGFPVTFKAPDE